MEKFDLSEEMQKYERYGDTCEVNLKKIFDDIKKAVRKLKQMLKNAKEYKASNDVYVPMGVEWLIDKTFGKDLI